MALVSVGAGVGSGDGVGTKPVVELLPQAMTRKPTATAARNDLAVLKV
jgi:hypothetical protein